MYNILPQKENILDNIIKKNIESVKNITSSTLERIDDELALKLDKKDFKLVRKDKRVIYSSSGVIEYKRRYYYNIRENSYVYPLDNFMGLHKNEKYTQELIIKILQLASEMSYAKVGQSLSNEFVLAKSTIYHVIKKYNVEQNFNNNIKRDNLKVHVQIDEKYLGMTNSKNKKRYYTATIFAGRDANKDKPALLNKTLISSHSLNKLANLINYHLITRYHIDIDEEIFLSGDLATYIQNFKERILCCKAIYVPDKFHVMETIKKTTGLVANEYDLNNERYLSVILDGLSYSDDADAKKLKRLIKNKPHCFVPYLDPEYLGCSQEAMNSHYYSPRFSKYASRFNPSSISKLASIIESNYNESTITFSTNEPEVIKIDIQSYYYDFSHPYTEIIDMTAMKKATREYFTRIIYGSHV